MVFKNTPLFQKLVQAKADLVGFGTQALAKVGMQDSFDLAAVSDDGFSRAVNFSIQILSQLVQHLPNLLLSLFVICAALFFFLAEAGPLKHIFLRQKVLEQDTADRFIKLLQQSCYNTVVSSVLISVIQATIVAFGAICIISGDFAMIWVVTFFCSFVPVIGAGPVAGALGAYQLVTGSYGRAIGLGVVALVAGTTDNLVRPFLISSGEEDLHPIVSLLAIIGALVLFGMSGLFLGPVIASVAVKIIPTLMNRIRTDRHCKREGSRENKVVIRSSVTRYSVRQKSQVTVRWSSPSSAPRTSASPVSSNARSMRSIPQVQKLSSFRVSISSNG